MSSHAIRTLCSIVTVAIAAIAGGITAHADDGARASPHQIETRSVKVRYADLDLTQDAGIRALYQRLRLAARQACGSADSRLLADLRNWQRCFDAALGTAVQRLDHERLTALHRDRNGMRGAVPVARLP